ncbi:hypothetical protein AAF712_007385 [Marasmius tenuissimus]|uniref:DNA polymerase lambda n=1 Tax=Marasmius tenuissimus TaxID=585030 RepID=A0ABR2ZZ71_9AGAR
MDVDEFFREQDRRMSIPDDDMDEFIEQMKLEKKRKRKKASPVAPITPRRQGMQTRFTQASTNEEPFGARPTSMSPMPSPKAKRSATKPRAKANSGEESGLKSRLRSSSPRKSSPVPPQNLRTVRRATPNPPISISIPQDDHDQAPLSSDIPTSPIEDASAPPSDAVPHKSTSKPSEPSLMDVISDQIANHTARKRHKLMKVSQRPSSPDDTTTKASSVVGDRSSPPPAAKSKGPTKNLRAKNVVKSQKTILDAAEPSDKPKKMAISAMLSLRKLPSEFAMIASEQYGLRQEGKSQASKKDKQHLKGSCIFYCGNDFSNASETTKNRMWIILRHGGTLAPTYDPSTVTHIVVDRENNSGPLLKAAGIKSLKDIPEHIPCVTWAWVIDTHHTIEQTPEGPKPKLAEYFPHAAFASRIPPVRGSSGSLSGFSKNKGKRKAEELAHHEDSEDEQIEDFTNDNIQPQSRVAGQHASTRNIKPLPKAAPSRLPLFFEPEKPVVNDPLAPFLAKARAEVEEERMRGRYGEVEDETDVEDQFSDTDTEEPPYKRPKGFACDLPGVDRNGCPNQDIIEKLQALHDLHKAKPGDEDKWRAFTYSKVIRLLRNHPKRIRSIQDAQKLKGIGLKTAVKIMEIIETGDLRRLKYENTESVQVTRVFQGIYGVGQSTALKWYSNGCRTLQDLANGKGGVKLSAAQKIGLKYYDDINDRMPREEAGAIFSLIKPIALSIDPDLFVEIMGSYRRGKADCGDIDIMITRPTRDGKTHEGVLSRLLQKLHEADILTEDLALPEDPDDLEAIYRGLCHLPDKKGAKQRRIDFLTVPWKNKGAALLYYTGDDIFNRSMRWKANQMGYSLNQRGLYEGVVRDTHQRSIKTNAGTVLASETEQEILKILEVPWQEPHERVR